MASLEDDGQEGALPGAGPAHDRHTPEAPILPAGELAQGAAPKPDVVVDGGAPLAPKEAPAPREVDENVVLYGEPEAPPLGAGEGGLNETQRAVMNARLMHPDATPRKLAEIAGTSTNQVSRILALPAVRRVMAPILDKHNASLEECAEAIGGALKATKKVRLVSEGAVVAEYEDPDHKIRLEAAELGMKGHGAIDSKDTVSDVHVSLSDEQLAKIAIGAAMVSDFIQRGPR